MPKFPWETVLPIAGSLLSTHIQNTVSRRRRNYDNTYNSPKAQIERLKEAGLSPAMMYSGGQTLNAAVKQEPLQIDKDLGTAEGIQAGQKVRATTVQDQIAQAQINNIQARTEGQQVENKIKSQELQRYDSDRNFWNYLKQRKDSRDQRTMEFMQQIQEQDIEIRNRAQQLGEQQLGFNKEKFIVEQQLARDIYNFNRAKTAAEVKIAKEKLLLDYAKVMVQQGHLQVSESQLEMAWKKYDSDYALWNAIDNAFDGNIDWQSITKQGAKGISKSVLKGLKNFILK